LISRNSFDTSALTLQDWLAYPIIEPGSWVMERKMLLTIKPTRRESRSNPTLRRCFGIGAQSASGPAIGDGLARALAERSETRHS
jgi:hypothetical protein